jgi:PhnB protein
MTPPPTSSLPVLRSFSANQRTTAGTPPASIGSRTVRVEVFVDDPDAFIERAVAAGADGSVDKIRDHEAPWGVHRQGGFLDPFGHLCLVGDRSPPGRYGLR